MYLNEGISNKIRNILIVDVKMLYQKVNVDNNFQTQIFGINEHIYFIRVLSFLHDILEIAVIKKLLILPVTFKL